MRILYALNLFRPSIDGVSISIERQAIRLARRGHEVAVIAPGETFADYQEHHHGIRAFRLKAIRLMGTPWRLAVMSGRGIEQAFDEFQPDAVVVTVPFLLNRVAALAARQRSLPVVGITGMMPEWFFYNLSILRPLATLLNDGLWRMITDFYNQCDFVVGVTPTALEFLSAHGLSRPATVISNGVQLERFYPRPRDRELAERFRVPDKPTVLYAGRLDAEKCLDVWLRAAAEVVRHVDAHFIIGGDGTERAMLQALAHHLGIGDRVTFPGFLDEDEYARLYSLAHVFAIASPAELQSIVTLEAAATGLPIVAVNAGALPELVQHGVNGFLFGPGDAKTMAAHVVRLLTWPRERQRMGEASLRIAEQHDIEGTIDAYEQVYLDVVRQRALV
jgi:1,2-diacylglycerol 3-alpha-glucosyltransferase